MQDNLYQPSKSQFLNEPEKSIPMEGYGKFDLGGCFQIAIDAFKVHWGQAIGVMLLALLIQIFAYLSVYLLIGFWLAPILHAGFSMLGIELVRGRLSSSVLFRGFDAKGPAWTSTVLSTLIFISPILPGFLVFAGALGFSIADGGFNENDPPVAFFVGYVALIVSIFIAMPFIYFFKARLILVHPLVFDRGFGGLDAIKESWRVTRDQQWMLMLHIFVSGMVAQAGVALCYIGMIASIPFGAAVVGAAQAQLLGEFPAKPGPKTPEATKTEPQQPKQEY